MKPIKLEIKKSFGALGQKSKSFGVSFLKSQQSKKNFEGLGFLVSAIEKSTDLDPNKPKMRKKHSHQVGPVR